MHVRGGTQLYCVLDTADISSALDGKRYFQMVFVSFCRKQRSSCVFSTLFSPEEQIVVLFLQINVICRVGRVSLKET